jgi:hypothetical protein
MTGSKAKNSILHKLMLTTAVAGVAFAIGGTAPVWAQDVGVFGTGTDRLCNTVIDSAGNPVMETGSADAGPCRGSRSSTRP